jgi:hypothetical protein
VSGPDDIISSEQPAGGRWRRPREAPLIGAGARATAMTAALTLVVGAGVATAAWRGTSSGTAPEALIPANAFAVATADLSLPGGQAGALDTLLGRFPGLHLTGDGSIRDRILRTMLHSAQPSIDYDADVKPWLGDHVAIAGWNDNGKPEMEVLLQSTDDGSARQHLTDIVAGHAHVVMRDGYAVLGSSQQAVDDALAAAGHSSLRDAGPYDGDVSALPDNEAITAWFDGPQAKDVLGGTALGGAGGAMAFSGLGALGSGFGDLLKGRAALGVHVTDTVAELDARSVGQSSTTSAPATMLTTLPSGTIGAFEVGDPGAVVDAVTPLIKVFGSFASGPAMSMCYGSSAVPVPSAVPGLSPRSLRRQLSAALPPGTAHRRALIRHGLRNYHKALTQARHRRAGIVPMPQCTSGPSQPPSDPLAQIQKFFGISFPDNVKTVLGDRAVVAFGGLELAGLPDVAIRTHPTDLSAAQSLANTLSSTLSSSTPVHIDVSTAGDDLVLATSPTYGQEIAKAGDLGGQDAAKAALGDIPADVGVAGYVNLSRVWPLIGAGVPAGVQHLHAIGFWASTAGDVQTAQLRVVFG